MKEDQKKWWLWTPQQSPLNLLSTASCAIKFINILWESKKSIKLAVPVLLVGSKHWPLLSPSCHFHDISVLEDLTTFHHINCFAGWPFPNPEPPISHGGRSREAGWDTAVAGVLTHALGWLCEGFQIQTWRRMSDSLEHLGWNDCSKAKQGYL